MVDSSFVPSGDGEELNELEKVCLNDEKVKEEIAKLKLPEGSVVCCDPWIYGTDDANENRRLWQAYMYMRNSTADHVESNHYAFPLDFSPIIEDSSRKVIRILRLPLGPGFETSVGRGRQGSLD